MGYLALLDQSPRWRTNGAYWNQCEVPDKSQALAAKIARELFTDGSNQRAARLVLEGIAGNPLGGWSEDAARLRIEKILENANAI